MPIQRFRFALSFGWHGFKCRADVDHITPTLNSPLVATLPHSPDRTPRPRLAARTTPFSRRSEPRGSRLAQLGLPSGSATRDSTFGRGCPAPPVPECVSPQPCRRRYKVLVRPPNMTQTFPPGNAGCELVTCSQLETATCSQLARNLGRNRNRFFSGKLEGRISFFALAAAFAGLFALALLLAGVTTGDAYQFWPLRRVQRWRLAR